MPRHRRLHKTRIGQTCRFALRAGATSVEFALVAIPLFVLVLASIEFGRGMMVVQAMEEAAHCGCRTATLKGQSLSTVEAEISQLLTLAGVSNYTTEIQPLALTTAPQWSPVTIRVSADLNDITWMPVPKFLAGYSYTATCVLPREAEPE